MRVLFLVHGMGVHGGNWEDVTRSKLNDVAGRYPFFKTTPLAQLVKIVAISYDEAFTAQLQEWDDSVDALEEFAATGSIQIPRILTFLRNASETEKNFFWSHVVDVVLYRFFPLIAVPVRLRVMSQMATALRDASVDGTIVNASVLAHSLGTAVAHDALSILGTTAFDGSEAFLARNFRFDNVFMVANVGRILETVNRCYDSCVHPVTVNAETAYCTRYYNFRHKLDPFPVLKAFAPDGWGSNFITPSGVIDHLHDFNVHGFEHYLDHPAVHIPILNGLFGRVIGTADEQKAVADYPRFPPDHPCVAALTTARERYQTFVSAMQDSDDPFELVRAGVRFLAAVKEAGDACS